MTKRRLQSFLFTSRTLDDLPVDIRLRVVKCWMPSFTGLEVGDFESIAFIAGVNTIEFGANNAQSGSQIYKGALD